jgi:hypothetical protein
MQLQSRMMGPACVGQRCRAIREHTLHVSISTVYLARATPDSGKALQSHADTAEARKRGACCV